MNISQADLLAACRHNPVQLAAVRGQLKREPTPVGDIDCTFAEVASDMELKSGPNSRGQLYTKTKRVRAERERAAILVRTMRKIPRLPATVTLTRVGRRKVDQDNLSGLFKATRDGIADVYGVDDGSDLYQWVYSQEIGGGIGIRITLTAGVAPAGKAVAK